MTDARRKVKIVLLQKQMTFEELAAVAGLAIATVHNVLDNKASSEKSKRAITDALQVEIFPGVVPRPSFTIRSGTVLEFPKTGEAKKAATELGDRVTLRGNVMAFVRDTKFTRLEIASAPPGTADTQSRSTRPSPRARNC